MKGVWSFQRFPAPLAVLVVFCTCFMSIVAVKHENYKTCVQSGFCSRNRAIADKAAKDPSKWSSPYELDSRSIKANGGQLTGNILKDVGSGTTVTLPITISFLKSGAARVTVDEKRRQDKDIALRHDSKARKERYNEAEKWAISGGLETDPSTNIDTSDNSQVHVKYGGDGAFEAFIKLKPFAVDFKRNGELQVQLNERGLMNLEEWRAETDANKSEDERTWWDEAWGGATDSKPLGPESVALDITFRGYEHVMGIPEHASSLSLKETRGGDGAYTEPYRLYNADVFEYELDSPMTLYGSIPYMQAQKKNSTVGVFFLNAAEMWIDIIKPKESTGIMSSQKSTKTHWIAESGLIDFFVFLGPTPQSVSQAYSSLTGTPQMPQSFAIAYHQCRWNYVSTDDVLEVDSNMDKNDIPYDVIWLDIEYTDDKKYFTWNPKTFADPGSMTKTLDEHSRKLVTIIDPHIKKVDGYAVSSELQSKNLAMLDKSGSVYEGWCWPGASNWVDCFNPAARAWLKTKYAYEYFKGTMRNVFIWNDMNEPSVFNGPETTAPRDNLHHGNWEHRALHNLNGLTFHNATHDAIVSRSSSETPQRPFVLTRSFFAGSQRLGPMWTGDNLAQWAHLHASIPMILSHNVAGMPFAGADVGGFFGNPPWDLFARWYQAGAFYPFFRGHAHIDAKRREPYLAPEPQRTYVSQALKLRYALLPTWYTAHRESYEGGTPIARPLYYDFPGDETGFEVDDQFFVGGSGLLVKPITTEGATSTVVYFPGDEPYYDYADYSVVNTGKAGRQTVDAPPEKIPLFMRGGHIFPRRDRPRRSSGLMASDPITLVAALDRTGSATGSLYLDDGASYDFEKGGYVKRLFTLDGGNKTMASTDVGERGDATDGYLKTLDGVKVERIILVGTGAEFSGKQSVKVKSRSLGGWKDVKVTVTEGSSGKAAFAVIENPGVGVSEDWRVDWSGKDGAALDAEANANSASGRGWRKGEL